ncbi:serine/threonine-protein kinase VIK-like [Elaeis guineensis]|uniref:serine/threonine-protein kinase VIK-like n=1 Tax=Elaeis guineensis var. tenera TaxID=51953 RepID=UPI003C6D859A
MRGGGGEETSGGSSGTSSTEKQREKARVSRTSLILWHTHQNDVSAVRKLLEEDPGLVNARDYDNRTPLHVASIHGWIDVSNCLLEYGADVNAQDRWKNTPLADAEGAKKFNMIELLKSYGGLSFVSSLVISDGIEDQLPLHHCLSVLTICLTVINLDNVKKGPCGFF